MLFKDTSLSSLQVISFPMNRNNGVFQFMYAHLKLGQDFKLKIQTSKTVIDFHPHDRKKIPTRCA